MSKRQHVESSRRQRRWHKRPRPEKKHLYVALDDWDEGFTIHKISLDSGDEHGHGGGRLRRLPETGALRIKSSADAFLVAMGSEIFMATNTTNLTRAPRPLLVYDTAAAAQALSIGPRLPPKLRRCFDVVTAVGKKVYVLSSRKKHSFEVMSREPATGEWSWESITPPPPFGAGESVTSYAVHPDERTIFMTITHWNQYQTGTYSFDTELCLWRWHGKWVLPFEGQGYFNEDLDAWIGLHKDGYICSCKVASRRTDVTRRLDWTMVKQILFGKGLDYGEWNAILVSMDGSKFCLVESIQREESRRVDEDNTLGEPNGFVLHLTMFSLEYDKKKRGLQANVDHPIRSYITSRHMNAFSLEAFWL